ncbi:MAG TPA: RNA-binding protein [Alphaproteobacteria bacterium]|nr:RNA-binding protein [Alphaproteobacteria bacterium]
MPRPQTLERQCALTREVKPVADLIRFVVSPDGELVPDTDARAEGRGVWISLGEAKVAEAVRRKAFERSLKENVRLPEDLPGLTRRRLTERYVSALQMARKAGQLVTGAHRVREAIAGGSVIGLITATDAAADGRQKLLAALRAQQRDAAEAGRPVREVPHLELLDSGQLGLALGLESVIHAALVEGAAAQSALQRAYRLARYLQN